MIIVDTEAIMFGLGDKITVTVFVEVAMARVTADSEPVILYHAPLRYDLSSFAENKGFQCAVNVFRKITGCCFKRKYGITTDEAIDNVERIIRAYPHDSIEAKGPASERLFLSRLHGKAIRVREQKLPFVDDHLTPNGCPRFSTPPMEKYRTKASERVKRLDPTIGNHLSDFHRFAHGNGYHCPILETLAFAYWAKEHLDVASIDQEHRLRTTGSYSPSSSSSINAPSAITFCTTTSVPSSTLNSCSRYRNEHHKCTVEKKKGDVKRVE